MYAFRILSDQASIKIIEYIYKDFMMIAPQFKYTN